MRVKAKRLGWDEELTLEQSHDLDDYDYASDDLEGELEVVDVPAAPRAVSAYSLYLVGGQEADPKTLEVVTNAFCPTGQGGGVNPHCSPGGAAAPGAVPATPAPVPVHAQSGLPVGLVIHKMYQGVRYEVEVMAHGLQVRSSRAGTIGIYPSLRAAGIAVRGKAGVNGWAFFGITRPTTTAAATPPQPPSVSPVAPTPAPPVAPSPPQPITPPPPAPTPAPTPPPQRPSYWQRFRASLAGQPTPTPTPSPPSAPASNVPFSKEISWETGKSQTGQVLNGVPFESAPDKFWEKTKDVDVNEPDPTHKIVRVGVLIKEKDGRVWIAEPTNHFGGRNHTLPGGTIEPGLTMQQNALKETWEETGLQVKITGHLGDFGDSNYRTGSTFSRYGRLYLGERVGGAPWDAKLEPGHIPPSVKNGSTAESETVKLVTPDRAAELLHRTDDLAQLATAAPIDVKTDHRGNMMSGLVEGVQPAAKAYSDKQQASGKSAGDSVLHVIQDLRGFNDKPTVVSKADMDGLIASGTHIDLLRGISGGYSHKASDLAEAFKTGDHYPGYGCFGNGTYFDGSSSGNVAYAGGQYRGEVTVRAALPKSARIIEQSELEKACSPHQGPKGYADGKHGSGRGWQGCQAALAGYDAIHVDGKSRYQYSYGNSSQSPTGGYYVVLNRSILTVQKENARDHRIK